MFEGRRMKKKISFKEWELAVREARAFINRYDKVRWKIVNIALRVCDTSHGGRKGENVFSVTKFANAIDLNPKTLLQWIRVKQLVVDKLPKTELKNKALYNFTDLQDTCLKVNEDSTKKEVLRAWIDQINVPRHDKKFIKYEKHINAILFNAQKPIYLIDVNEDILLKIANKCELVARLLKAELEFRKKYSIEERLMNKTRKETKAIKEANKNVWGEL